MLAAFRNAVVHLLAGVEAESRPAAIERLAAYPNEALGLLGLSPFESSNDPGGRVGPSLARTDRLRATCTGRMMGRNSPLFRPEARAR